MAYILCCHFCSHRTSPQADYYVLPEGWRRATIAIDMRSKNDIILCPACITRLRIPHADRPDAHTPLNRFIEALQEMVRNEVEDANPNR